MSSSVKLGSTHITGPPRFLGSSLSARRPQPPRQAQWLLLVSFTTSSRFHPLCKVDHLHLLRNEAESGSLSLRLTPSSQGASTVRLPFLPPLQLHVEQVTHMTGSFHPVRSTRFILAHQRTQRVSNLESRISNRRETRDQRRKTIDVRRATKTGQSSVVS